MPRLALAADTEKIERIAVPELQQVYAVVGGCSHQQITKSVMQPAVMTEHSALREIEERERERKRKRQSAR